MCMHMYMYIYIYVCVHANTTLIHVNTVIHNEETPDTNSISTIPRILGILCVYIRDIYLPYKQTDIIQEGTKDPLNPSPECRGLNNYQYYFGRSLLYLW